MARERAREAARNVYKQTASDYRNVSIAADAASDVWEPLLLQAVELLKNDGWNLDEALEGGILHKLKEALGDG